MTRSRTAIGQLRDRVAIEELRETENDFGELAKSWAPVATVWAKVEPLAGRELWQAQQVQADVSHRITLRYRQGLKPTQRLRLVSVNPPRVFNLQPATNPSEKRAQTWMEVLCKEEIT